MFRMRTLLRALSALLMIAVATAPYGASRAAAAVDVCKWREGPFHMEGALELPETTLGLDHVWTPGERDSSGATSRPSHYERHHHRHRDAQSQSKERLEREHARHHHERRNDD